MPNNLECDGIILGIDLMKLVCGLLAKLYQSYWGDEIKRRRATIKPPDDMEFKFSNRQSDLAA
jgi:hypothetical protein